VRRTLATDARTRVRAMSAASALLVRGAARAAERDTSGEGANNARRPADVGAAIEAPARLGLGVAATSERLASFDIDVNAEGLGLPPGRGTTAEGALVYAARCASCHGTRGERLATFPRLVGAATDTSFRFGDDVKLVKTPGNYWPYATTLYDYIHRAMPFDAPGSLRPDEVYGLVAYLLAENRVVGRDAVTDAHALPAFRMPARKRFVPDDRHRGPEFR
jgi:cytochrome c